MNSGESSEERDLSFVLGGPLYQLLLRSRLTTPTLALVHRRIAASVLLTWLPLALLTALSGHVLGGAGVPFLMDLDVHARFLLSLPLMIWAEVIVHRRGRAVLQRFLDGGLIGDQEQPRFEAILRGTWRLRNSILAEVVMLVLAFTVGHWLWRGQFALPVATWFAAPVDGATRYTAAGWWYVFFSMPIARFILLRWFYRLVLWFVLMLRVARLALQLNPLHPDRAGGLGFLGNSIMAFVPVLMAQTVLLAGMIGNQIWHEGTKLPDYKIMIVAFIAGLVLIVLLPPGCFVFQMARARREGLRHFGLLASRYTDEFRRKWLEAPGAAGQELLGSGDIQSLADLGNSYEVVRQMRMLPFDVRMISRLAIMLAVPLVPLALTMIRLEDILTQAVKVLL